MNVKDMMAKVNEEWLSLQMTYIMNVCNEFSGRVQAIVDAEGGPMEI